MSEVAQSHTEDNNIWNSMTQSTHWKQTQENCTQQK